jgi:hypothetical protein
MFLQGIFKSPLLSVNIKNENEVFFDLLSAFDTEVLNF